MRTLHLPPDEPVTAVLYVTKGLAGVVEAEFTELVAAAAVTGRAERHLLVRATPAELAAYGDRARTVEDVRLLVGGPQPVGGQDEFAGFCAAVADRIAATVEDATGRWSVTVAARTPPWKRRSRRAPGFDPAPVLAAAWHGADPAGTVRRPVDVRLQVDGEQTHAAVNLWDRPVGKAAPTEPTAPWKGALRPTVAASLVRTVRALAPDASGLYDPFCGSGTIVDEAVRAGLAVFASDHVADAVELTRTRLAALGVPGPDLLHRVFLRDVRRGPDQRVDAQLLVANLPWGAQVPVEGRLALFDAVAHLVAQRIRAGGAAALLTTHEEQLVARLRRHSLQVEAVRIGLLGQTPAIVTARVPPEQLPPS